MCRRSEPSSAPAEFFGAALACFERAVAAAGEHTSPLEIGGRPVRLRYAGDGLAPVVGPALEHLRAPEAGPRADRHEPALTVALFDTRSTGVPMTRPPWGRDAYGDRGMITGYNDPRHRTRYEPGVGILQAFDADRSTALYWTRDAHHVPWWEASFPFRTILHWWCATTDSLQPVHAGAVGRDGAGVLIAGHGGSGKSTTALACLDAGLAYAGDDYVLADVDRSYVHTLYATAKLRPDNLARFPRLARRVANRDALDEQKALLYLAREFPTRLAREFALRGIVLPRVTGDVRSRLRPATPRDALAAIAPATLHQLPGDSDALFAKLRRLTENVPVYRLDAGTDLERLAGTIDDFLSAAR